MVNTPSQPSGSSTIRPYADGPEFLITDDFLARLGEWVAYRPHPLEYLQAIAWEIARAPRHATRGPDGMRQRYYDFYFRQWLTLRIWVWFESEDHIVFSDVEEA